MATHNKSICCDGVCFGKFCIEWDLFAFECGGKNSFQKSRKHTEKSVRGGKKGMKEATEPPQDGQRITLRERRRTLYECAATPLPILYNQNPFPPLLSSMDKGSLHDITK